MNRTKKICPCCGQKYTERQWREDRGGYWAYRHFGQYGVIWCKGADGERPSDQIKIAHDNGYIPAKILETGECVNQSNPKLFSEASPADVGKEGIDFCCGGVDGDTR